jgi:hypothetical protein
MAYISINRYIGPHSQAVADLHKGPAQAVIETNGGKR